MKAFTIQFLILIVFLVWPSKTVAGLRWVDVGVNGLTCSMCTRSVDRSISRLEFVDSVVMSLEKTEGRIYLKEGEPINIKEIAKAVVNAGFSVRFVRLGFNFSDMAINPDGSFAFQGQVYQWVQFKNGQAKGEVVLKLVDEDFLPRKEYTQWKKSIGYSTNTGGQKVFHVVHEI